MVVDCAETVGANDVGDNLQNPFIEYIPFGRNSLKYLRVNFNPQCTNELSKKRTSNYHRTYESSVFDSMISNRYAMGNPIAYLLFCDKRFIKHEMEVINIE